MGWHCKHWKVWLFLTLSLLDSFFLWSRDSRSSSLAGFLCLWTMVTLFTRIRFFSTLCVFKCPTCPSHILPQVSYLPSSPVSPPLLPKKWLSLLSADMKQMKHNKSYLTAENFKPFLKIYQFFAAFRQVSHFCWCYKSLVSWLLFPILCIHLFFNLILLYLNVFVNAFIHF